MRLDISEFLGWKKYIRKARGINVLKLMSRAFEDVD